MCNNLCDLCKKVFLNESEDNFYESVKSEDVDVMDEFSNNMLEMINESVKTSVPENRIKNPVTGEIAEVYRASDYIYAKIGSEIVKNDDFLWAGLMIKLQEKGFTEELGVYTPEDNKKAITPCGMEISNNTVKKIMGGGTNE